MNARTPMMRQYGEAKAAHPDALVAMRVGDFYEFYGEDAKVAAAALEIALTGREDAAEGKIPMAGVPFHSVEKYLARLLAKGHKVALCDQLEDPKTAKGLVKRGVTRVLTSGTVLEDAMLPGGQNNYLAAVCVRNGKAGLATLDSSTGEFMVTEIDGDVQQRLLQELARIRPAELLVDPKADVYGELARNSLGAAVTELDALPQDRALRAVLSQFQVANLQGFGCEDMPSAVVAASMILSYAELNHVPLAHVDSLSTYSVDSFMRLDPATRRSLELTQNMGDGTKKYTLLETLDRTVTAMGGRLLRRWVEQPLLDVATIRHRQEGVERMLGHSMVRGDLRDALGKLSDLERLVSRAATGLAGPRDMAALRASLLALPELAEPLRKIGLGRIQELRELIGDHSDTALLLDKALVADPPHSIRDGGSIRAGYDPELDKLRDLSKNGKGYIASLEQAERAATGIASLKVGFNSVFGYFLEVPRAHVAKVPEEYIRKQTTANGERYITAQLKEHEAQVLGADEKAASLEASLFGALRARVAETSRSLLQTARALAEIDALASLAEVAAYRGYVRPEVVEDDAYEIRGGRHPVVEESTTAFVPNDVCLGEIRTVVLTGPNMSGKSTYLRQTALIALMGQIGSFVPAASCKMSVFDRIFARIGARDELALGQSTFMVEMVESANILNHATERSLVILDEVGRGTSTFDGLAIAWAMIESLAGIGCKTLFATHYHQLNALADQTRGVANFRAAVEEVGDDVVWTHKVLPGGADKSYGIHVARLAGVPTSVLGRSAEILAELEGAGDTPRAISAPTQRMQMTLFEADDPPVVKALQSLDLDRLTPVDALKTLDEWKRRFAKT